MSVQAEHVTDADGAGKFPGAETARRTVRLLEALAARQPIGLDELAEVVGLNRSTTYRLLRVLQDEGYSERLPRGGYRLGPAVAALVSGAPLPAEAFAAARPALRRLAEVTGESVGLYRRAGDTVVLSDGVESEQHALRHVIQMGSSNSILIGVAGNAILAALDEADRTAVLDRGRLRPDARRALERDLAETAARGYALSPGVIYPGLFTIAAAVPPPDASGGTPELSVAVSGPDTRWTQERALRHVDDLLRCCAQVAYLVPPPRSREPSLRPTKNTPARHASLSARRGGRAAIVGFRGGGSGTGGTSVQRGGRCCVREGGDPGAGQDLAVVP